MSVGSPDGPQISVIVRARDEEGALRRCLQALVRQQTGGRRVELIVVDGGSRDDTIPVATAAGARVLEIAPDAFSFGRSLNVGCQAAGGGILVALSAHALPPDDGWLARLCEPFADPRVACACGDLHGPGGAPLGQRVVQDVRLARALPEWGYSNAAGAVRAALWRRRPFREDLLACEDKEWAWHWLGLGYLCVVDRALVVDHDHTHDSLRLIYARAEREWEGIGSFMELAPYTAGDLLREWWSDRRWYASPWRARLSHRRVARLLGAYTGRRAARGG